MNTPSNPGGHTGRPLAVEDDAAQMPLNSPGSPAPGMAPGMDPAANPLPGSGETDFSFLDAAAAKPAKRSLGGVGMVLLVVAIGAAALYGMRLANNHVNKPDPGAAAAEKKIDLALAKLAGEKGAKKGHKFTDVLHDTDQIIAMFASDPASRQVDVQHLQKNPFEMFPGSGTAKTVSATTDDAAHAERLRRLRMELEQLKLQSVLSGNGSGFAVISGKVVREGGSIGSFVVTSIAGSTVKLSADGNTYTLAMAQPSEDTISGNAHSRTRR